MAQIVFPPNPNVGDTVTGEYGEVYTWDGQKWTITPGAGGGVAIEMGEDPPADPIPGNLWWSTGVSKLYLWDGLQWVVAVNTPEGGGGGGGGSVDPASLISADAGNDLELGSDGLLFVPPPGPPSLVGTTFQLSFFFAGQPASDVSCLVPVSIGCTIAPNLAGASAYSMSPALTGGETTFTVYRLVTSPAVEQFEIGTVTFAQGTGLGNATSFAGPGGTLNPGDVVRVQAPDSPDMTMAEVGITLLATRT